jgi:hypothetical protein
VKGWDLASRRPAKVEPKITTERLTALRRKWGQVVDAMNELVLEDATIDKNAFLMVVSGISADKFDALLRAADATRRSDDIGIVTLAATLPEPKVRGERPPGDAADVLADRAAQMRRADEFCRIAERAAASLLDPSLQGGQRFGTAKTGGIAVDKLLDIMRSTAQSPATVVAALFKVVDLLADADYLDADADAAASEPPTSTPSKKRARRP